MILQSIVEPKICITMEVTKMKISGDFPSAQKTRILRNNYEEPARTKEIIGSLWKQHRETRVIPNQRRGNGSTEEIGTSKGSTILNEAD